MWTWATSWIRAAKCIRCNPAVLYVQRVVLLALPSRGVVAATDSWNSAWHCNCEAQWSLYVPPVVTICTASGHYMYRLWSLYVPPVVTICTVSLTFNNSTFCPHTAFTCSGWIWEQTAIISLYSINWLVCITDGECLLRGTDRIFIYTHIIQMNQFPEYEICTLRAVHCSHRQVSRHHSAIRSATRQWAQRRLSDGSDWFIKTQQSWRLWLTGADKPSRTPESIFNLQPALRSTTDGIAQQYKQTCTQKASNAWFNLNMTQTLCRSSQYTRLL